MPEAYFRRSRKGSSGWFDALFGTFSRRAAPRLNKHGARKLGGAGSTCRHRPALKALAVALSSMILLFALLNISVCAPLSAYAENRAEVLASDLLNAAIMETVDEYRAGNGADFARQTVNEDGTSCLFIDAAGMSLMAARIMERAQLKLNALSTEGISVRLGSASGLPLLNGTGPSARIGIEPVGAVAGKFDSSFTSAGVNQTLYRATLKLSATMRLVLFGKVKTVEASCASPLCETIIVGGVPNAYTNVESLDDALNLIPTDAD